jgi:uncharacterized membrane protein YfcA
MPATLLVAAAILGIASAAQAISGFGFALLAVPLLTLIMPTEEAVIVASLASLALTAGTAIRERTQVDWPAAHVIMLTAVVGMPVGLLLLDTLPERALTALVGATVLISTLLVWRRPALPNTRTVRYAVGALTGVLTTSTGTNGPPLVAAFQNMGYAPRRFRATIAAIFTGCGVVSIGFFAYGGDITGSSIAYALAGVPAVAIGWLLGDRIFRRINPDRFRHIVLVALVLASIVTLARTL